MELSSKGRDVPASSRDREQRKQIEQIDVDGAKTVMMAEKSSNVTDEHFSEKVCHQYFWKRIFPFPTTDLLAYSDSLVNGQKLSLSPDGSILCHCIRTSFTLRKAIWEIK